MKAAKCTGLLLSASLLLYAVQGLGYQATATSSGPPPNDSKTNQRDAHGANPTPQNQPNDKADVQLAARVRKAIVGDHSLSSSAHNVKLIAIGGVVTLRGVVRDAGEKARVEAIAGGTPGVTRVDNQLDVEH
ncbi:BON domain-containing protein [Dyella sp. EPa41]|uniref:BON domain-containing protein n=1 Tax=Dyella sp. EPa41 TaxID=1561194 RepID=UPI001915C58A|nr:BON domain-containing protein [Dyella sp. EPa41]